jgi:hypothetical protein
MGSSVKTPRPWVPFLTVSLMSMEDIVQDARVKLSVPAVH